MSQDARVQAARALILELSEGRLAEQDERVDAVLAGLEEVSEQLAHQRESEQRLQEVADALFRLAALDFSESPKLKGDGSVLDAVMGCVNMLSEELIAHLEQRSAIEQELERRVGSRTAELMSANAQLRYEVEERVRAEQALRKSEAQLSQAMKMEAVGRLSGGVAHDFNNLLSVIISYTTTLLEDLSDDHPMRQDLEEIQHAGQRAAELTRQLLAFSRRQVMEPKIVDLNALVSSTGSMLRRLIGEDIELKLELDADIGRVRVDPGQMTQVLMNLVVNARDAMPSGGTLRISTAQGEPLEDTALAPPTDVPAGPCVRLRVSDTGTGMDEATKARIFEPFFTTKEPGAGTGLGLATVFGIIQQSGGSIRVLSAPGTGATFEVYLPQTVETGKDGPSSPVLLQGGRGAETILLVEDDDQVRQLIRRILESHGYQVFDACDPQEAPTLFETHRHSIHLLLTDVVMPRMSGRQLAEKLLASRERLKVLYMSGYTEDVALRHGIDEASVAFLQKPVTPEALLSKLREVLGASLPEL